MDQSTAAAIVSGITGAAFVVWLIAWRFVAAAARRSSSDTLQLDDRPSPDLEGSLEVEGAPAELASRLVEQLLAGPPTTAWGTPEIIDRGATSVAFEAPDPRSGRPLIDRADLKFGSASGRGSTVDYEVRLAAHRGPLLAARIVLAVGLVALVALAVVMFTVVVPSESPAVRGQAFQMVQIVHLLWPPFLLGGLHRMRCGMVQRGLETLVHNLPHVASA